MLVKLLLRGMRSNYDTVFCFCGRAANKLFQTNVPLILSAERLA